MFETRSVAVHKRILLSGLTYLWITLLIIGIDRYSKLWISEHLELFQSIKILSIFNLTLVHNKGAAFSLLNNGAGWQNILLGSFACIVGISVIIWLSRNKIHQYWLNTALSLILGGAMGNLWDRISQGYVIDFLDFHLANRHFAIFNIADSAICVGALMMLLTWFKEER